MKKHDDPIASWRLINHLFHQHGFALDYETILANNYRRFLKSGDCIADVGAHLGVHTKQFLEIVGPSGKIIGFEPLEYFCGIIAKDFAANSNVSIRQLALSDYAGESEFTAALGTPEESGLKRKLHFTNPSAATPTQIKVKVSTLDQELSDWSRLDYIKIDIEGAELDCLAGGKKTLARFRPIVSFECGYAAYGSYGKNRKDFFDFAVGNDLIIFDLLGNKIDEFSVWDRIPDNARTWDFYYVPKEKSDWFESKIAQNDSPNKQDSAAAIPIQKISSIAEGKDKTKFNHENRVEAARLRARLDRGQDISSELRRLVDQYPWYHRLEIIPGILTTSSPLSDVTTILVGEFKKAASLVDFKNKRVLDVGCRDGAQLFIAEEFGANELIGIDNDVSPGLTDFLIPFRNSKIRCIEMNLFDLNPDLLGQFDIVICCGVLYHLRYPVWGLKKLADMLRYGGTLILETGVLDSFNDLPLMLYTPDQTSPYEYTSPTFFNLPCLHNALAQTGFDNINTVAPRIMPYPYQVSKHYPEFSRQLKMNKFNTARSITIAEKKRGHDHPYFEGVHAFHSSRKN